MLSAGNTTHYIQQYTQTNLVLAMQRIPRLDELRWTKINFHQAKHTSQTILLQNALYIFQKLVNGLHFHCCRWDQLVGWVKEEIRQEYWWKASYEVSKANHISSPSRGDQDSTDQELGGNSMVKALKVLQKSHAVKRASGYPCKYIKPPMGNKSAINISLKLLLLDKHWQNEQILINIKK